MSPNIQQSLSIEFSLLGFLRQKPLHGYQIYQQLSDPSGLGLVWRIKQSQLYALLSRLEGEGYITAELEPQDARPTRKVYRLTERGKIAYEEWVQSPVPMPRRIRQEFLAKLYFARQDGPKISTRLIGSQRAVCQSWLADLTAKKPSPESGSMQMYLIYQYRLHHVGAILDWLELCNESLPGD
jgi:DNA-binding PadR family transcriptional regulator